MSDDLDSVETLLDRAQRARRENRLEDARRDMAAAVTLSRDSGPPSRLVRALKGLAQIERDLGQSDLAFPLYEEAVQLSRRDADPLGLAHTIRHLGDLYQDAGRLAAAEPYYREALELYRAAEQPPLLDLANAIRPLALLLESTGGREEASRLWEEARSLYTAVDVPEGVAESAAHLRDLMGPSLN